MMQAYKVFETSRKSTLVSKRGGGGDSQKKQRKKVMKLLSRK
jgi:hypothetical protein